MIRQGDVQAVLGIKIGSSEFMKLIKVQGKKVTLHIDVLVSMVKQKTLRTEKLDKRINLLLLYLFENYSEVSIPYPKISASFITMDESLTATIVEIILKDKKLSVKKK